MKKKSLNGKMTIEASNIIEEKNNFKIASSRSKSLNKKLRKREEVKQLDVIIEKKYINFNLDFIYRRERYSLKNLLSNCLVSKIKKLISKKISVDVNLIHIYYLDKEITNDRLNIYDLINNNKIKLLEVKKEAPINKDVISLNINTHLIYKVRCKGIQNVKDFMEKIETFFRERCLEKHYLCEPIGNNTYDIGFSCEDNCFQFKRYMTLIKKLDNNYKNSNCEFIPVFRNEILQPIKTKKIEPFYSRNFESIYINKGPYMTYEEIQKRNEREEKKKWISKKDFVYKK